MTAWRLWGVTAVLVAAASIAAMGTAASTAAPPVEVDAEPYRVIGVWEGQVAVFLPQATAPERVLDTRLATLPAEEQERLHRGIDVTDEAMLARCLEDYTS